MRYGSPYGAGYGSPDNCISYVEAIPQNGNTSIAVAFTPRTNWGNAYWGIYRNGRLFRNVWAAEGSITPPVYVPNDPGSTLTSIVLLRIGHLADPTFDISPVAREYDSLTSPRVTLRWNWTPEIIGSPDDGGVSSSWVLNGLTRAAMRTVPAHPTWTVLDWSIAVSGPNATVTVYNGNSLPLASGTGTFPGTITLTQLNSSGISGSVALSAGAVNLTATLNARWFSDMLVRRDVSNPPSPIVATVPFNFKDTDNWTEPANLTPGTYYYRTTPQTDTGENGTNSTVLTAVVPGPPNPPTNLAYQSGNAAATVLSFTASGTAGVTYRAYLEQPGAGFMNMNDIAATAGIGATTITLPAITGYAGTAYVTLRAVNAGVEDKNKTMLALEYDGSGNFVPARPNTPFIDVSSLAITSGLNLSIVGRYNSNRQKGVATQLQLFTRTPTGSYNFASPAATASLSATNPPYSNATLNYTFLSSGYYYITIMAATAGGTQSAIQATEMLVYVSTSTPANVDPTLSIDRS